MTDCDVLLSVDQTELIWTVGEKRLTVPRSAINTRVSYMLYCFDKCLPGFRNNAMRIMQKKKRNFVDFEFDLYDFEKACSWTEDQTIGAWIVMNQFMADNKYFLFSMCWRNNFKYNDGSDAYAFKFKDRDSTDIDAFADVGGVSIKYQKWICYNVEFWMDNFVAPIEQFIDAKQKEKKNTLEVENRYKNLESNRYSHSCRNCCNWRFFAPKIFILSFALHFLIATFWIWRSITITTNDRTTLYNGTFIPFHILAVLLSPLIYKRKKVFITYCVICIPIFLAHGLETSVEIAVRLNFITASKCYPLYNEYCTKLDACNKWYITGPMIAICVNWVVSFVTGIGHHHFK